MSEGLTAAAIDRIVQLAEDRMRDKFVKVDGDSKNTYWKLIPGGGSERVFCMPPDCTANYSRPDDIKSAIDPDTTIYYDREAIRLFCENRLRVIGTCKLLISPQFDWLEKSSKQWLSQQDFVRTLRIEFRNCIAGNATDILSLFRSLKFQQGAVQVGNIQHGKESMGKSIEAKVENDTSSLPDEMRLTVPVWQNWRVTQDVWCAIEIDSQACKFKLTPYPSELDNALDRALAGLHEFLTTTDGPSIYRGCPKIEDVWGCPKIDDPYDGRNED